MIDLVANKTCNRALICWFAFVVSFANGVVAGDDGFVTDVKAAADQAKVEDKSIMLLFTGSDWCPPCQRLEAEVFSQQEFLPGVQDHFVLVRLDFPRTTELPEQLQQQNEKLSEQFGVQGFPTVVMTDASLTPFAFAGYQEGGAENYIQIMNEAHARRLVRDQNFAAAAKQTGDQRALLLDAAISELGEEIVSVYYADVVAEIVSLDSKNELGLRQKWNAAADAEARKVILADIAVVARLAPPQQAIEFIDEVLAQLVFSDTEKLNILQARLNLARKLGEDTSVDETLDQMLAIEGLVPGTRFRLLAKKAYAMAAAGKLDPATSMLQQQIAAAGQTAGSEIGYLHLALGELLNRNQKTSAAIEALTAGVSAAGNNFDLLVDVLGTKSDVLFEDGQTAQSLRLLDQFADNETLPEDLRAELLLQKAMLMRKSKRVRQARLVENRAIEIVKSPAEKAAVQKMVDLLQAKSNPSGR